MPACYTFVNTLISGESQVQPSTLKYSFRLRTRHGLMVENVSIHGRDEADAERKLRQMYMHCEILSCVIAPTAAATLPRRAVTFEDVVSLISK